MSKQDVEQAVEKWAAFLRDSAAESTDGARTLLAAARDVDCPSDQYTAFLAEALACGEATLAADFPLHHVSLGSLEELLDPFAALVVRRLATLRATTDLQPSSAPIDYELLLRDRSAQLRNELGVFYTPKALAEYTVRQVHEKLRDYLGLPDGLADTTSWRDLAEVHPGMSIPPGVSPDEIFVRILEPAAGTGVFVVAAIKLIFETLTNKWRSAGADEADVKRLWNSYGRELLPRLTAFEILPTASLLGQLNVVNCLVETGYSIRAVDRLQFFTANTLLDPAALRHKARSLDGPFRDEAIRLANALDSKTYTVVLGNPPFRGVSDNTAPWMQRLLRGRAPDDATVASYYHVDGQPLGERKVWLQDDYVKFLRHAHWQIERAGAGVVGFVTNHGYLDNTSFRGVRRTLQETFGSIDVVDLHGNRKKGEATRAGGVDESVFEVEQGVAVGVFARSCRHTSPQFNFREVWGTRDEKLAQLNTSLPPEPTPLQPMSPHFLLIPTPANAHAEYQAGFPINEVMPVNSTAVVTARDRFVIAFTKQELIGRMRLFRDPTISDDEIRARFFTRGRSNKYPPGDTRGWQLAAARQRMMSDSRWDEHVMPCAYRPFDRRVIYWADWMIDWPRTDVMRHMIERDNIALVTRRQVPTGAECNFFWVTDSIAIDGLIRSDNRGSESVFPLFRVDRPTVNLSAEFINAVQECTGLEWQADSELLQDNSFGPWCAFRYIYALFSSRVYRERYAVELRHDFPRILLPRSAALWKQLSQLGGRLVDLHLSRGPTETKPTTPDDLKINRGFPNWKDSEIRVSPQHRAFPAKRAVWEYRVGTHQVCRKWLRDRRTLSEASLQAYPAILDAIASTLELTTAVDSVIAEAGGWPHAFLA